MHRASTFASFVGSEEVPGKAFFLNRAALAAWYAGWYMGGLASCGRIKMLSLWITTFAGAGHHQRPSAAHGRRGKDHPPISAVK